LGGSEDVPQGDERLWHEIVTGNARAGDTLVVPTECAHRLTVVVEKHPETGQVGYWAPAHCSQCETGEWFLD
jgi:hypothetical protein